MKKIIFIVLIILTSCQITVAEMSFDSIYDNYHRAMTVAGYSTSEALNFHYNSLSKRDEYVSSGPWKKEISKYERNKSQFSIQPIWPEVWGSVNTARPYDGNDGSIWQGKGINSRVSGGLNIEVPNIIINITPEIWFSQNLYFDIINTNSSNGYGDYWTDFDNLQRYGNDPYFDFSFGQSVVRWNYDWFSVGLSNESIRLGPGQMNNLLLSNNAGGFPHIDFGTDGKVQIGKFGELDFKWMWGGLHESKFYDDNSNNDWGWISGTYVAYSPSILPNFMIGFNHQYYKQIAEWDKFDLIRGIPFVDRSNSPGDYKDMMMSIPFRWLFPEVGFEAYGEWARNDNFGGIQDLYNSPEHTHAFTIGVNQILREQTNSLLMMSIEFSSLAQERTYEVRPAGPWYRHAWAGWTQGYTYNGQVLGAAIGPGSDSQWLKFSYYNKNGMLALFIQRVMHDKDYYYKLIDDGFSADEFSEFNIGIENLRFLGNYQLYSNLSYVLFINNNYVNEEYLYNVHLKIGFKYEY